jgi:hypothetical protein
MVRFHFRMSQLREAFAHLTASNWPGPSKCECPQRAAAPSGVRHGNFIHSSRSVGGASVSG